jgi:hypothetical protein
MDEDAPADGDRVMRRSDTALRWFGLHAGLLMLLYTRAAAVLAVAWGVTAMMAILLLGSRSEAPILGGFTAALLVAATLVVLALWQVVAFARYRMGRRAAAGMLAPIVALLAYTPSMFLIDAGQERAAVAAALVVPILIVAVPVRLWITAKRRLFERQHATLQGWLAGSDARCVAASRRTIPGLDVESRGGVFARTTLPASRRRVDIFAGWYGYDRDVKGIDDQFLGWGVGTFMVTRLPRARTRRPRFVSIGARRGPHARLVLPLRFTDVVRLESLPLDAALRIQHDPDADPIAVRRLLGPQLIMALLDAPEVQVEIHERELVTYSLEPLMDRHQLDRLQAVTDVARTSVLAVHPARARG